MNMQSKSPENNLTRNTIHFKEENLRKLLECMTEQTAAEKQVIFNEGDPADRLYYIFEGTVKITKMSEEGKEYMMYLFRGGDLFGQLDPYHDSKQSFQATSTEVCRIGSIHKDDLETLLWQHESLAIDFMKWMGLMNRLTESKFRDLMMYGKPGALSSTLIRLSNSYGVQTEDGIRITIKLTHSELGNYIGSARESVNRMLNDLKRVGAISFENGFITIKNIHHLREICHCEDCPNEICRL